MLKHDKPGAFYDTFERKGPGDRVPHYCPGCGHGNMHKLIAEAVSELGIQDRTVFLSPVGCSAFAYYYFDTGNVACSHGRAPAVGTGISRTLDNAVVISYQGDGDLAGIGMAEIMHAANRGEHLAVFFINNAIYGMTGGQTAPTTLLGQKTATSPLGRQFLLEGGPIRMAELINQLDAPVFIERVSLSEPANIIRAKKAVHKALLNQAEGRGFSFVEALSPCPVGWKMTPVEARRWIKEEMEKIFPPGKLRDRPEGGKRPAALPVFSRKEVYSILGISDAVTREPKAGNVLEQVKIAGFGGQGVLSLGVLLANCALAEGFHASWLPSYGPEMRGGTANAGVVISTDTIGSPVVDNPDMLIVMNGPSLESFQASVKTGGTILLNSSLIGMETKRKDVRAVKIPAMDIARDAGFVKGANIVMLTVCILLSGLISIQTLEEIMPLSLKRKEFIEINRKLIQAGADFHEKQL